VTNLSALSKYAALAIVLGASTIFGASPADVPSGTYVLEKTHTSLTWKVKHMDLALYSARFTKYDITIKYDSKTPANSSVVAIIDPNSVRTDYPFSDKEDFDKKIATDAKLFNSAAFPEIKFVSTKLVPITKTKGRMTGNLSFIGVTKPVVLEVELTGAVKEHRFTKGPALGFSALGSFKRSDFGMTTYGGAVGDEVQLEIHGEFLPQAVK
jgi:polyisoprenoid-binding protein YceI